ncbi:MAG: hypothetical protein HQL69_13810 [Magnetococcales bacterium]|nr:hypothetical protein [Magnetococcales bacterium]
MGVLSSQRGNRAKRVKAHYPVQLDIGDTAKFIGKITDMSEVGLYMSIKHTFSQDSVGEMGRLFLLPKVAGYCKIVRIVRVENGGLGLQSV